MTNARALFLFAAFLVSLEVAVIKDGGWIELTAWIATGVFAALYLTQVRRSEIQ